MSIPPVGYLLGAVILLCLLIGLIWRDTFRHRPVVYVARTRGQRPEIELQKLVRRHSEAPEGEKILKLSTDAPADVVLYALQQNMNLYMGTVATAIVLHLHDSGKITAGFVENPGRKFWLYQMCTEDLESFRGAKLFPMLVSTIRLSGNGTIMGAQAGSPLRKLLLKMSLV
ncbi:MAG TPA: hypothetical protein VLI92_02570 [Candidatus Saccharimonadales bacterium]|nr:hypothetical protein [Candidatus Saccharimonadales bacterium]